MKVHIEGVHGESRKFQCDTCNKSYTINVNLIRHKKEKHSLIKSKCDQCKKTFQNKMTLQNHMDVIHNDLKRFECDICKKRFVVKSHLSKHEREVHLGKKVDGTF